MVSDKDILFITTSMYTKWGNYSHNLISKYFPESEHIIVDGTKNWWVVWFDWLKVLPGRTEKYFVHIDEDAFITNKDEIIKLINLMDEGNYSLSGIPDGGNDYRGSNPVSINPFFMVGNISDILSAWNWKLDNKFNNDWIESSRSEYSKCLIYKDNIKFNDLCLDPWDGDIFYPFVWSILMKEFKIKYLYPNYNSKYKSTDPSIENGTTPFLVHMWYTRVWDNEDNLERYLLVEKELNLS